MRWASAAGGYTSLTSKEAWDIEYWPLELYKLSLKPLAKELAGRVAVITGGAGAIGKATGQRLLGEDAHIVLADIDGAKLNAARVELPASDSERITTVISDASMEAQVRDVMDHAVLTFGEGYRHPQRGHRGVGSR